MWICCVHFWSEIVECSFHVYCFENIGNLILEIVKYVWPSMWHFSSWIRFSHSETCFSLINVRAVSRTYDFVISVWSAVLEYGEATILTLRLKGDDLAELSSLSSINFLLFYVLVVWGEPFFFPWRLQAPHYMNDGRELKELFTWMWTLKPFLEFYVRVLFLINLL